MAKTYLYASQPTWLYGKRGSFREGNRSTQLAPGEPCSPLKEEKGWLLVQVPHYEHPGWIPQGELSATLGLDPDMWWESVCDSPGKTPFTVALQYLDERYPYVWGGLGLGDEKTRGIDCSGLVHMAHRRVGMRIPRDSGAQEARGRRAKRISWSQLQRGDLITYGEKAADHIAFYAGNGKILHSTVREDDGINGVVLEEETAYLKGLRRCAFRFKR